MSVRAIDPFLESESAYQLALQAELEEHGEIGEVLPWMILRNVPLYALARLWKERHDSLRSSGDLPFLAFVIAEEGWRGRLENVHSRLHPDNGGYRLDFAKSYVMSCEVMLLVARLEEDLALVWLPREDAAQQWQSRGEASVRFANSRLGEIDHYRVSGDVRVESQDIATIKMSSYRRVGMQIPLREATSLALMAMALLRHHKQSISPELKDREASILKARDASFLKRAAHADAAFIMNDFYSAAEQSNLTLHPFWDRARNLFGFGG